MREMLVRDIMRRLVAVGAVLMVLGSASSAFAQAQHVRWDIVSINFAAGTVNEGGMASAKANDNSKITMTGSGTFVAPGGGGGTSGAATGGGTYEIFLPGGTTPTSSGTYQVTGLVRWQPAPGTPPPLTDNIDDGTPSAGLAVLRVAYSDGAQGILVVSCHLVGTPDSVFEGITASKGFVDYWNREAPAPLVDADRTLFHIQ
jgi:hypothetical protein